MTDPTHHYDPPVGRSLCRVVAELHQRGWCSGTSGNFSVVVQEDPLRVLITQSGLDKRHLELGDLVVVGSDGRPVEGESGKPSAEALLHATVASLTGARSVLHTHSVWNTLLGEHFCERGGITLTGYEMLKGLEGIRSHQAEVFVPVVENSQDIALLDAKIKDLIAKQPGLHGFLIAGHGLYTWGVTLEQAQRHVEIFEFLLECVGRRTRFRDFEG